VSPDLVATRAITVRTSPGRVWPWIAQLGQGRGGFYSYDFLENLAGCDIHSADRIVPEWLDIKIGDEIKLAPAVGLEVIALEPERSLVLRGGVPMGTTRLPTTSHALPTAVCCFGGLGGGPGSMNMPHGWAGSWPRKAW
jgi:hypothetical protein